VTAKQLNVRLALASACLALVAVTMVSVYSVTIHADPGCTADSSTCVVNPGLQSEVCWSTGTCNTADCGTEGKRKCNSNPNGGNAVAAACSSNCSADPEGEG